MKKITTFLIICFFAMFCKTYAQSPVFLKYINEDETGDQFRFFTEYNNKTYFIATGNQLWVTNGESETTTLVKNLSEFGSDASILGVINNKIVLFVGNSQNNSILMSDGTSEGTVLVKDGIGLYARNPNTAGNKIFFRALTANEGLEWWVTDCTAAGTHLLKDINPGAADQLNEANGIAFQDKFFFYGYDATDDAELWMSDGTEAGTVKLTSVDYVGTVLLNYDMVVLNDKLFFTFHDLDNGVELWSTDGTQEGTQLFKDFNAGFDNGWVESFHFLDDKLLFMAYDSDDQRYLWSTDGTLENTVQVKKVDIIGGDLTYWEYMGGKLYFSGQDSTYGNELWVTDGTSDGTHMVKDINTVSSSSPVRLTSSGDKLFFYAYNADTGNELWVSDGTEAGTVLVKDIYPGNLGSMGGTVSAKIMIGLNNKAYFVVLSTSNNFHLYESDGTANGTVELQPANATITDSPLGLGGPSNKFAAPLYESYGVMYFQAKFTNTGFGLYKLGTTVLGVEEQSLSSLKVYPNPVNDVLNIEGVQNLQSVIVYNNLGQKLMTVTGNNTTIDVSGFSAGWYFVEIASEAGKSIKKIIKN